jgi:hypothetical protein
VTASINLAARRASLEKVVEMAQRGRAVSNLEGWQASEQWDGKRGRRCVAKLSVGR